jgi:hypothetical protein
MAKRVIVIKVAVAKRVFIVDVFTELPLTAS